MFPNVRLIIVAITASLLAIGCAMSLFLGMFAAFSGSREPFSALPTKPPLQIAFGGESSAPVVDGKPSPFGIRFQLNAPQTPSGPVIVAVPAALDRIAPGEAPAAVEPAAPPPQDDAAVQAPDPASAQDVTTTASVQTTSDVSSKPADVKQDNAKQDAKPADMKPADASGAEAAKSENKKDPTTAALKEPAPSSPRSASRPIAPEIRIVAREADNPASVATAPAPTLARKVPKRRKLAVHLHQSHHFRRPRIYASGETSGYVQPNGFVQPGFSSVSGYAQPHAAYTPSAFGQQGFQFTPAAIRPRARWRHAAVTQ
jgi:hypothetical protein